LLLGEACGHRMERGGRIEQAERQRLIAGGSGRSGRCERIGGLFAVVVDPRKQVAGVDFRETGCAGAQ
jgi:hypothetical protein